MEPEILPVEDEKKQKLNRLPDDYWVIDNAPAGVTKRQLEALARRLKISMRAMVSRSKWGDLQAQVRDCRSQSPRSTAGNTALPETLVSKAWVRKGGQEGWIWDVGTNAIDV